MSSENQSSVLRRRSLLALVGASFLLPGSTRGIARVEPTRIPDKYIQDLLRRTEAGRNQTDGEFAAGQFMLNAERNGAELSAAIMQLEGVHPNLAVAQISFLLSQPFNGMFLSRDEKKAIVYLSNTWPDHFEPFYEGENVETTRAELLEYLHSFPSLQRTFRRYGRPVPEMIAQGERRSPD